MGPSICATTAHHLPSELWLSIMSGLSTSDLLTLSITCKLFNCLANDVLRNVRLPIHKRMAYRLGLVSLVKQARLVRVGLDLSESGGGISAGMFSRDCLRRFLNTNQQKLYFQTNEEMSEFFFPLSNLRLKVNLGEKSFTYLDSLFAYLSSHPYTLKALDCEGGNLSRCEPDTLARGVCSVLIANLERVWLSSTHINKIFITMGQGTSFLQFLSLAEENLSEVDKEVLANGVVNLKEVDLSDTKLSKEQLNALLEKVAEAEVLTLTYIRLASVSSLASVSPSLLSRSVPRLARADLQWTSLSSTQLEHLLTTIVQAPSAITSLSLAGLRLSTLPTSLLTNLLTKLTVVDLSSTGGTETDLMSMQNMDMLTLEQNMDMLTTIATGNTRIHSMALDCSSLEGVPEEVVVGLCNTLSRLVFCGGGWDSAGVMAEVVYSAMMNSTTMVDCSMFCCGIATATMITKYPSADTYFTTKTRGYFLNM